jgi:hypothetical protein
VLLFLSDFQIDICIKSTIFFAFELYHFPTQKTYYLKIGEFLPHYLSFRILVPGELAQNADQNISWRFQQKNFPTADSEAL